MGRQVISKKDARKLASEQFPRAREIMRLAFENDGGNTPGSLKHTYIANMAMLLHDKWDVPVNVANQQAIDLLDLIFSEVK